MNNATNTMLCWNPGTDQVALVPWPGNHNYACDTLACWGYIRDMDFEQRKTIVFIEAVILIVRDKCDPQAVHKALMGLDEYRDGLPEEMLGMERGAQT